MHPKWNLPVKWRSRNWDFIFPYSSRVFAFVYNCMSRKSKLPRRAFARGGSGGSAEQVWEELVYAMDFWTSNLYPPQFGEHKSQERRSPMSGTPTINCHPLVAHYLTQKVSALALAEEKLEDLRGHKGHSSSESGGLWWFSCSAKVMEAFLQGAIGKNQKDVNTLQSSSVQKVVVGRFHNLKRSLPLSQVLPRTRNFWDAYDGFQFWWCFSWSACDIGKFTLHYLPKDC